jgi:TolA-binding protein
MTKIFAVLLVFFSMQAFSQETAIYQDPEREYQQALDLFEKEKYGAAQKLFLQILDSKNHLPTEVLANASYYSARCATELFNQDAEYLMLSFIEKYPTSTNYSNAIYDLGIYYYRLKKYKNAIDYLARIDQSDLSQEKKDEVNFKIGYSYYMTNDYDKASKSFLLMKDGNSKYASAAQYYYAHVAFVNENYETALQCFLKLKDSEAFAPVAPYYITQIYYRQKKYDEVLKYAPSVLDTAATRNGMEIGRMVGESYYRTESYKEALPYLLDYEKNSGAANRSDYYSIAFSYYRTKEYEKAVNYFQKAIGVEDTLTQNSYFHLADCQLNLNNKRSARTAFQSAAKSDFNMNIKEESSFNYAKLSYELSFQSVALESFRTFMKDFPNSQYFEQANEMLISIYTNTRNYKDALVALEGIKNKTQNIKIAYQKVAYYRGVELFMDNNSKEAIQLFKIANQYPNDQNLVAEANYWTGEANYKLEDYEAAIKSYNNFILTPAALNSERYNLANYNVGYSYFKLENFPEALNAFRKYVKDKMHTDVSRYNDAILRIADCYFTIKDQASALDYYNQAIAGNSKASDYALYQKAALQGIQGKFGDKVNTLQKLFEKYPKSVYYDDGLYEAGQACMAQENFELSLKYFKRVINEYPNGIYLRKSELGEALVYYNTKQDDKALAAYKKIVSKYPNTPESHEALGQIQKISVSQNKVDEYLTYIKGVPNADVSDAAQDSITYEAAEALYTQGNCTAAISAFDSYMLKFPQAIFKLYASYYKSDCLYKSKKYQEALPGYEYVITQPKSNLTEKSLLSAAAINFRLKAFDRALGQFEALEGTAEEKDNIMASYAGQMRTAYKLKDNVKAAAAAQKILNSTTTDKDLLNEAHLITGKAYFEKSDYGSAKTEFAIVAKRTGSEMTAESKYYLAAIENRVANYKESNKIILEIQKLNPSYDYWIAKGFILFGDNYLAQKDTFQAKETYKSIVANYEKEETDVDDLKEIARQKLEAISLPDNKDIERKLKGNAAPEDSTEINSIK